MSGFPSLKFFRNGEPTDYTGGRTKDTIVSWILKKSGPASTAVDCDALKKKVDDSKFVLAYFGEESDALFTAGHVANAETEESIQFVHNNDAACAAEFGAAMPGEVLFRKFETNINVYSGAADKDTMNAWYKGLLVPVHFKFTEDEIEAVFGQQMDTLIFFRTGSDSDAAYTKVFEEAATAHKGKMLFSYSDKSNDIQSKLADFMGVTDADLPTLRAIVPSGMKKFACPVAAADLTVDNIGSWVDDIKAGTVKPHLKSEPVPETQGPVTTIVGTTWEEIVMDPTKDVLVKYYAPWCGHCKKLAPIWEELGEFYADNENLVIAKFDSTANEAENVNVKGYPTLIFYPKDNKKGMDHSGGRDLDAFKTWLNKHSPVLKEGPAEVQKDDL